MTLAEASPPTTVAPASPLPASGEALVRARCGTFGLLVPLAAVARVLPAALPAARPAVDAGAAPVVSVGGNLLPVIFGEALLGAGEVRLRPGDQLLVIEDGPRQALLWVSAVEDVLACQPLPAPPGRSGRLVAGWSGVDEPLAVLDVARAIALAAGELEAA